MNKIYKYDIETKEFREELEINENYGSNLPFTTSIKPKATKSGFTQCFNEEFKKWEYVEDNRGKTVYSKTTKETIEVDYLGKIKDEHTLLVPNQFDKWSEASKSWIEDEALKKEFENQEKLQEINSLKEYLKDTDFYYTRLAEIGEAVPVDVVEKRLETRAKIRELEDN
ncbi:hypothetical protein [Aliarcobacter butzleri]|uniref:hypothetical protein n=1 Tax=Aliarcobacter butzleri TaxID=28197 RepID=UPI00263F0CD9|nr:hypothetical protein [Aliarcobacter butzleri]MDN5049812.1 hypothetical protein [Aliarcobacter butzleri]MDN5056871.1 hypothetical protein [Aliarcobacter butzleri]